MKSNHFLKNDMKASTNSLSVQGAKDLYKQAQQHLSDMQFRQAEQCCENILQYYPRHSETLYLIAHLMRQTGQDLKAIEYCQRAIAINGTRAKYFALLAYCFFVTGHYDSAIDSAAQGAAIECSNGDTLESLGSIFIFTASYDKALVFFEQAIRQAPGHAPLHYGLGNVLRIVGRIEEAGQVFDTAIKRFPHYAKFHWALSHLARQSEHNNHISILESELNRPSMTKEDESYLHFALAKEYDDIGNPSDSFASLVRANELKRETIHYDIDQDKSLFRDIRNNFTAELLNRKIKGHDSSEPIFIVGMPRSGTTLVEQIVSSHSSVQSKGELVHFGYQLKRLTHQSRQGWVHSMDDLDFNKLGKSYIDSVRSNANHSRHFTDKLPTNFLYIGLIRLALPNAKIIHVSRNPLAICYSNFRLHFSGSFKCTYSLSELGEYYLLYHQLMNHWRQLLADQILEVSYENLVQNQETETRRILTFCGLEWQDSCLSFYKNSQPVASASSAEVREPIYQSSVQHWLSYKKHLAPLIELIQQAGIQFQDH